MKKLIVTIGILMFAITAHAETYYVRADGTSDKATATSGTSSSTSMSLQTFNAESFSPGDEIIFDGRGGSFTGTIKPLYSGTETEPILIRGDDSYRPVFQMENSTIEKVIDIYSQDYIEIDNFTILRPKLNGVKIHGDSKGIVIRRVKVEGARDPSAQGFNIWDDAEAEFYEISAIDNTDDGFSMHGTARAWVYDGYFARNKDCVNLVENAHFTGEDIVCIDNVNTFWTTNKQNLEEDLMDISVDGFFVRAGSGKVIDVVRDGYFDNGIIVGLTDGQNAFYADRWSNLHLNNIQIKANGGNGFSTHYKGGKVFSDNVIVSGVDSVTDIPSGGYVEINDSVITDYGVFDNDSASVVNNVIGA